MHFPGFFYNGIWFILIAGVVVSPFVLFCCIGGGCCSCGACIVGSW